SFSGGTGSLVLSDPEGFTGHIEGFTGTAPDAAHSDTIDLVGIDFNSAQFVETYNPDTGLLSVTDGNHSASFTFDNFNATLDYASDGNGGTLITDPPIPQSSDTTTSGIAGNTSPDNSTGTFGDNKVAGAQLSTYYRRKSQWNYRVTYCPRYV